MTFNDRMADYFIILSFLRMFRNDDPILGHSGSFPEAVVTFILGFFSLAAVRSVVVSHSVPSAADSTAEEDSHMGKNLGIAVLDTIHSLGSSYLAASACLTLM